MTVAQRLIAARGEKPRKEVAESVQISVSALAMYENGYRVPRDEIKVRLAKYYSKTVEDLFY